ncbi:MULTISPECIES: DNA-binding response regulator [unclassified Bradyrhizobium]|uniref:DNA-binding response regulator n=1 Tax=unclassified Bradyrhizobium TaxID=2631580 RepID=UPI002916F757|nr:MULTISPECIES: DNA-binding response regulator [unclassified Bradyrhizobium]
MPPPLRKRRLDGSLYYRPDEVEAQLAALEKLSRDDLLARCRIADASSPDYVLTECVLHFLRASHRDNGQARFAALYRILLERATRRLPRSGNERHLSSSRAEVNELVLHRLDVLISADREAYSEQLDFFEIRFDGAIAKLRTDALRKVGRQQKRDVPLHDEETGELSADVVEAIGNYNPFETEKIEDRDYRKRLDGAIDSLPPLQQRIVQMLRKEVPIDSTSDPYAVTISKTLGKVEKTIRSNRNKAFAVLRRILEGDQR